MAHTYSQPRSIQGDRSERLVFLGPLNLSELRNESFPEAPYLCPLVDGRVDQDEFGGGVDTDSMAIIAEEGELALTPWQQPNEVAVTKRRFPLTWGKVCVGDAQRGRVCDPLRWDDLLSFPGAVMSEKPT